MTLTVPPQDLDAERSVLAAMLLGADASALLEPAAFYRMAHRRVFEAITELRLAQQPADLITVCDALRRRGELQAVGGEAFVAGLLDEATTAANVEHHAKIVRGKATLRELIKAAGDIREACYSGSEDVPVVLERAESQIRAVADLASRQSVSLEEAAKRFAQAPARPEERPNPILGDGVICSSDLALLSGKPGLGKSRLAIELASACQKGGIWLGLPTSRRVRVGYLAAEFTRYLWWDRCVRIFGDGTLGKNPPADKLQAAYGSLALGDMAVVTRDLLGDVPDLVTDAGAAQLDRIITERGLELVIVDPLSRFMGDRDETSEVFGPLINRLDRVRYRTRCAILVIHHERKGSTDRLAKDDALDSVRGSTKLTGAIVTMMRLTAGHGGMLKLEFAKVNHADKPTEIWHRIPKGGGHTLVEQTPEAKANANRDKILAWVKSQANLLVSTGQVAAATGMIERTCFRHLETLADQGLIRRAGKKPVTWTVSDIGHDKTNTLLSDWEPTEE